MREGKVAKVLKERRKWPLEGKQNKRKTGRRDRRKERQTKTDKDRRRKRQRHVCRK